MNIPMPSFVKCTTILNHKILSNHDKVYVKTHKNTSVVHRLTKVQKINNHQRLTTM